jgi:hypothetical protein
MLCGPGVTARFHRSPSVVPTAELIVGRFPTIRDDVCSTGLILLSRLGVDFFEHWLRCASAAR